MTKIAQVSAYWGPAYPTGSGVFCYEISKRLAEHFEVHVFTSTIGNFNNLRNGNGVNLHPIHTFGTVWDMNPVADVFTPLMRGDFDIVHVHSYIFFLSNMAALARLFKRNSKYILHFHGGLDFSKDLADAHPGRIWAKEHIYDRTLGYLTTRLADRVLSVSKKDIAIVSRKFGVRDAGWVPIATDSDKFVPLRDSPAVPVVTYVGKLEKWKGIDTLLESFGLIYEKVKNVRFLVVGAGSMQRAVIESKLPIHFMGPVPYEEMPSIYQASSVLILPSYMEGFPLTCVEALACGVPVVATGVGDTAEIVLDGETGFLAEPGNSGQIASSIIEIISNKSLARRLGQAGREHILKNFSYEAVIDKLLVEYQRCLGIEEPAGAEARVLVKTP